jgi:hypothetical protein
LETSAGKIFGKIRKGGGAMNPTALQAGQDTIGLKSLILSSELPGLLEPGH